MYLKPRYEFLVLLLSDELSDISLNFLSISFYTFTVCPQWSIGLLCPLSIATVRSLRVSLPVNVGMISKFGPRLLGMKFKCCEFVAPRSQLCFCSATQLALDFPSYHLFDCFRQQVSWMSLPANRSKVEGDHLLQPWEEFWVVHQPLLLERGYKLRNRYDPNWVPSWYGKKKNQIVRCSDSLSIPVSNTFRSVTSQYLFKARSIFLPISPKK